MLFKGWGQGRRCNTLVLTHHDSMHKVYRQPMEIGEIRIMLVRNHCNLADTCPDSIMFE